MFKELKEWITDPVVATILMVAATVLIAAVVYGYVGGMGQIEYETPNIKLSIKEEPENNITLIHTDGEEVEWKDIKIIVNNESIKSPKGTFTKGEEYIIKSNLKEGKNYKVVIIWKPNGELLFEGMLEN